MKKFALPLSLLLLAGMATGQTMIPLPKYKNTYSSASATRGFYFQAPLTFAVVGLRVPDEKKFGKQNVAVYLMNSKPPAYPSKGNNPPVFYKAGVPSANIIPCNIIVHAGQWVGFLGACGDATIMHNSYGTPKFQSNVLGKPITLLRFLTQTNLVAQAGKGAYSSEDSYQISRVEVYVKAVQGGATAEDYGQGSNKTSPFGPIPMSPYSYTYSYSGHTRGFFFQAPVAFTILGLQVPDEKKFGKQNVAVYKLTGKPPAYPSTASGGLIFFKAGIPSAAIIPTNLTFKAGDWVGILGACGDATIMHNSYGSGPFQSNILGKPVTLTRFITQNNIVATSGKNPYSASGGSIGRVKVFVKGQPGPIPALTTSAYPVLGKTASLKFTANIPNPQANVVALGVGRASLALPFGTILIKFPVLGAFLVPGAGGNVNLPIPNNPVLTGAGPINFQGFTIVPAGIATSNGTEWFLGL